nr:prokaryotic DNA topoisomerase,DNA topoisomerase iii [Hymenolepis microstoma]
MTIEYRCFDFSTFERHLVEFIMNKQLKTSVMRDRRKSGDTTSTSKKVGNNKIGNHLSLFGYASRQQSDFNASNPVSEASIGDFPSFVSEKESEIGRNENERTFSPSASYLDSQNDEMSDAEDALQLYSEDTPISIESPLPPTKKTILPVFATKPLTQKKLSLNRSKSFSNSLTPDNGNNLTTGTESGNSRSEIGIADLAEALRLLSRDARFRSIRPPWRDPNSRPLPSDETASVEAMLREYNQLLTKAASEQKCPSLSKIAVRRPYHTTLNRWRQQERIQMENFYLADRLRNVRPSPETSRDVLLKRYKQYFVTPATIRCILPSSHHADPANLSSSSRSRPRNLSARPISRSSTGTSGPLTGMTPSDRTPTRSSVRDDPPPNPSPLRSSSRELTGISTPHSQEVLSRLHSVRRALHEHRGKEKL